MTKVRKVIFLAGILLATSFAANANKYKFWMLLDGQVVCNNDALTGAQISVYENGNLREVFCNKKNGKLKFTLHEGNTYSLKVEKEGFITKIIDVNTVIPKWYKGSYVFNFTVDMIPLPDNINYPEGVHVGKVNFNSETNAFENDWELTNTINSVIRSENRTAYNQENIKIQTF